MEKRELGKTGVQVSRLGLGTVKFGRSEGVKYPAGFEIPDDYSLTRLLSQARDFGINTLDTAPSYGTSEERLGMLLKGKRKDWVIIGKAGEEFEKGKSSFNFTPEHFITSLERTLKRLQTDYLDVLLIHSNGDDLKILSDEKLIRKMQDFKRAGMVRAIGASTKTVKGGLKALELMDVVMATYTPDHTEEVAVLNEAALSEKGVLLKKALGSGHADDPGEAIKFSLSHPAVDSIIVGTINPLHLKQNVEAAMPPPSVLEAG
jgi:aryl-alcohol dehydrogenase-like predicted oxidoreductase